MQRIVEQTAQRMQGMRDTSQLFRALKRRLAASRRETSDWLASPLPTGAMAEEGGSTEWPQSLHAGDDGPPPQQPRSQSRARGERRSQVEPDPEVLPQEQAYQLRKPVAAHPVATPPAPPLTAVADSAVSSCAAANPTSGSPVPLPRRSSRAMSEVAMAAAALSRSPSKRSVLLATAATPRTPSTVVDARLGPAQLGAAEPSSRLHDLVSMQMHSALQRARQRRRAQARSPAAATVMPPQRSATTKAQRHAAARIIQRFWWGVQSGSAGGAAAGAMVLDAAVVSDSSGDEASDLCAAPVPPDDAPYDPLPLPLRFSRQHGSRIATGRSAGRARSALAGTAGTVRHVLRVRRTLLATRSVPLCARFMLCTHANAATGSACLETSLPRACARPPASAPQRT